MSFAPKRVHLSWPTKSVLTSDSPMIQKGLREVVRLNPEWSIEVNVEDEINEYLYSRMDLKDFRLIEGDHIVPKTDTWRLIKMYSEGGVYVDIDRYCNMSFADVLGCGKVSCVLPTCGDYGFSQDFMMSTPGNPIFLEAHKLRMERRIHTDHVYFLGPQTYMHAVTKCLVGSIIDLNPGVEVFEQLRAVVEKHPNIRTYREDLPYNSVLYRGPNEGDLWEQEKRTLYRDYNLKHWTGEW